MTKNKSKGDSPEVPDNELILVGVKLGEWHEAGLNYLTILRELSMQAECAKHPKAFWTSHSMAVNICKRCPVQIECLAYAIYARIPCHVYGGKTANERREMMKKLGMQDTIEVEE
jgi:hypothetical protein